MSGKQPTQKQMQILNLANQGLTPALIAADLHLAESSIKAQLTRMRNKVKKGWNPPLSPIEQAANGNS